MAEPGRGHRAPPRGLDRQLQRDAGLSRFEYMTLAMLSEQPARTLGMSDLAAATDASLSRLSHVAKRLERQSLLRRAPDPDNGRYTNAIRTDAGTDLVVASAPGHVAAVRELVIDPLSPAQLGQLRAAGERILARVESTERPLPCAP